MAILALLLILKENSLKKASLGEMFDIIFGGRYIILLMGLFSVYCGFIYNDAFSKSINVFGSGWVRATKFIPDDNDKMVSLDPANHTGAYFYGVDPVWQISNNKIVWMNSFKMKASVVMGITQMFFGLMLKFKNNVYFRNNLNIIGEFIPEMIFFCSIFGYLCITIVYKYIVWDYSDSACAPSLLINLINIFMFNSPEKCTGVPTFKGTPTYLFWGQAFLQKCLIYAALLAVPWLLCLKPFVLYKKNQRKLNRTTTNFGGVRVNRDIGYSDRQAIIDEDELGLEVDASFPQPDTDEEEPFSLQEIVIHQVIHTIEFCLSCISHTASYLRLWALSLAHAQLSEVLWSMLLQISLKVGGTFGLVIKYAVFYLFATLTLGILVGMEGLSAFLHALRLHWVEFNSKFYSGEGYAFQAFSFMAIVEAPENVL